jgi:hypothetical protein
MTRTKYLKGACQNCGGHIEYPAEHIGIVVACPHCQQTTELLLLAAPEEPAVPRRVLVWTGIAVVVLGLGFGGALVALKRAQRWAEKQKRPAANAVAVAQLQPNAQPPAEETNSLAHDELTRSAVTLEKTPESSLVYAVGTLKNSSTRQHFGIKVELELSDAAGQKLGTASDYRPVLEPGAQWQFKALVMDSKTASAKITAIREDQ